ncbi:response regulator [Diaminobutyricimonas aerilata]|uniref:response regulator n=1 Tax=Diaminobutyricimonas aerilata TaxID=1162967 RepID=UPI001FE52F9C|nr:response regulator transcription factor [Diaminobutyricimonas aerilata]
MIADDDPLVRAGVRAILESHAGIEVVGEAADGSAAVDIVRATRPHVAVLDLRMPALDGVAAAAEIGRLLPDVRTIMLTTFGTDDNVLRALEGGVDGFLLKASAPQDLITGVRAVAAGGAALSPTIARVLIRAVRDSRSAVPVDALARLDRLSERERDVLALVGQGRSNSDIARELVISEGTVKGHVSAILRVLEVRNRVQAALLAHEAGLR